MSTENTSKGISRRNLIKGAVAGAGALALTGLGSGNASAAVPPKKWDKEADVVIIGAGGAGLMAGIKAQDAGAKVLVVEKSPTVYASSTSISGGAYAATGTKVQKSLGITDDSPEKFYKDIMKYGEYMNESGLVKLLAENSALALDFLVDNGMPFTIIPFPGHSANRFHFSKNYTGKDYTDFTWKVFQNKNVPIEFNTSVVKIFYDAGKKKVVGVEVAKGRKKVFIKANRAVVLACGGITGSPQMFDRLIPALADKGVLIGGVGNMGDGIKMAARDLGAYSTHLQYSATYPFGMEMAPRSGSVCQYYYFVPRGTILVNKEGKRYANEEMSLTKLTADLAMQTEKSHFMISDSAMWDETMASLPSQAIFSMPGMSMNEIQQEIKNEKVMFKADSIGELAGKAKIDPAGLEATVNAFNGFVKAGADADFKRSKQSLVREFVKPPFYAVRMTLWTPLGLGGVRVNNKLQVLDAYDNFVPGIYAAGETVGGVHGASYLSGCAMAWAHTSGFLAGKYAAAEKA